MRAITDEAPLNPVRQSTFQIDDMQTEDRNEAQRERIGVAGLGFLGRGIAACLLAHGFGVAGYDQSAARRDEARCHIESDLRELVEQASFPAQILQNWRDHYIDADSTEAFSDCVFIVESITEDLEIKRVLFDELEAVVRSSTPIASNTSTIPISQLQVGRLKPDRIVGMHWAEPAHVTRFLEVIRGEQTSDATLRTTLRLARRIGKEPCLVEKDIPAFLVNRLGYAIYREAAYLLERGVADADTIDRAFRNAVGLWAGFCGPLRWIDLTGGPSLYARALERVIPDLCSSKELPIIFRNMIESGAHGMANGRGFYDYTPEEAKHWEEGYRRYVWRVCRELDKDFTLLNRKNNS